MNPILLIHGAWHGGACWSRVQAGLAAAGRISHAMDLPGAGLEARFPLSYLAQDIEAMLTEVSPLVDIGLQAHEDAAVARVRALAGAGGKVVLAGHSFGGCTVTRVAEKVPELVAAVVYLAAFVPVRLPSLVDYMSLPEGAESKAGATQLGDPTLTGAVRINNRSASSDDLERCRLAFYNDVPTADFLPFAATLVPDVSIKGFTDDARGMPERWGRLPRSYIRCTLDQALPLALQDRMIAEADAATPDNRFTQHTLLSSHSPFASMPDALARLLASLS